MKTNHNKSTARTPSKAQTSFIRAACGSALTLLLLCAVALGASAVPTRGQVTVQGSTTVLPFVQRAAEEFMLKNPSVSISVRGGGSGNGIAALIDSTVDIAVSSRFIKPDEVKRAKANGVSPVSFTIALDGIAVIVNPSNSVSRLSLSQLKAVYTGRITNWKQLGGPDRAIVPISRDSSSGTFEVFSTIALGGARVTPDALLQASNGAVADIVSRTPGAVGYVGIGYLSSRVKAIQVRTEDPDSSYVTPSYASVQSGKYPMARELFVFTNGSPAGAVLEFIDFMMSPEGQKLAEEEGFVPIMPIGQQ